jgi:transketolase
MKNDLLGLHKLAQNLRARIIENSFKTGTPHLGSCLSCIDLLTVLYFSVLNINPKLPQSPSRDRLILSKGHGAPALFQTLAEKGFYDRSLLDTYGKDGSFFAEHPPTPDYLPGIEAATGSLGHGLPIGLGIAIAANIKKLEYDVYVILGDGECNEGSIWESSLLASAQKVNNLCVFVDFNKWQATGRSEEVMGLSPLLDKWKAFGWNVLEIDGHDIKSILDACNQFQMEKQKPTAIIANTIKGKGVSFMEDDNNWHYRIPNEDEVMKAKIELGII